MSPQQTGVPDGWEVVTPPPAPPPTTASTALPETRMPTGTPARGRGTQLNVDRSNAVASAAVTPLAHPTGIDAIDGMTSPLGLASLAAGGVGVARAGVTGGALAAVKTAVADAAPLVKYEATKAILERLGVPAPMATVAAMAVSGYTRNAKGKAAAAAPTPEPMPAARSEALDLTRPAKAGALTQDEIAARVSAVRANGGLPPQAAPPTAAAAPPIASGPVAAPGGAPAAAPGPPAVPVAPSAAPRSTAGSPPSGRLPRDTPLTLPEGTTVPPATAQYYPQKFLNEVAIQAKRQGLALSESEYAVAHQLTGQGATPAQAVQTIAEARMSAAGAAAPMPSHAPAAPAAPAPASPEKFRLSADESKLYMQLRKAGKTHADAAQAIAAQRAMAARFGLPPSATVENAVADRNATGRWRGKDDE